MKTWPPKDWRAIVALLLSAGGAGALTLFVWWLAYSLQPEQGWHAASEVHRAHTLRWIGWLAMGGIVAVLLGLGMAINRRSFKGNIGKAGFDFEGGDGPTTPAEAAQATAQAAEQKAEEIASMTPDTPEGER